MSDINNITNKIVKGVIGDPRTLQDTFEKVLTLKAGLQLAKGVHQGRYLQVKWIFTDAHKFYNQEGLMGVHLMHIKDNKAI